jgi:hypothetical protein
METAFQFPAAAPDDPSDVALAVQTAGALWRQGDSREALKWLRRAAESAETEGDDMRALTLARAAAELKDRLPHLTSVPPPPTSAAPAAAPTRVSAPPSVAPSPFAAPASNAPRSQIPPAPALVSSLTTDLGLGPEKLEAWSPPSSRAAPEAAPPAPVSASAPAPATAAVPPPLAREPEPAAAVAPAAPVAPAQAATEEPTASAAPPISARAADARTALRVSVEVLSRGSGSLLVRVLGEGEKAPPGAREALLVPLDAGVDLRNP